MYAINSDIAFVFGGLEVSAGTIHSLLLRTVDGGKHWKEVMPRIDHNDITHVVFIDNGEGWAIATWVLEDLANPKLWYTTDYGETWQEIKGRLPADSIDGIRIFDNQHIQVKSVNWRADPTQYLILNSNDGGMNWNESFNIRVNEENLDEVLKAYAETPGGAYGSFNQCGYGVVCVSYGQDGSKWQIQNMYSKKCVGETSYNQLQYAEIRRVWLDQETIIAIPVYFYFDGNKVQVQP
jgi:photosystem II stability/assembly factor-like uncharacterized protein